MNISENKYIKTTSKFLSFNSNILLVTIATCSFKFYGYVIGFIFLIPFLYARRGFIIDYFSNLKRNNILVLSYLCYLIIESIYGTYNTRDFRIVIYWSIFFLLTIFIYLSNNYYLNKDENYKKNYIQIIFNTSQLYFLIYIFMNIFSFFKYGNAYEIQNLFWVGGATAFNISSLFLYTLLLKWRDISFKINSIYLLNIILYTSLVLVNESRLGQVYLFIFFVFTFIKSIQIKKLINSILIISLCLFVYSIGTNLRDSLNSKLNQDLSFPSQDIITETSTQIKDIIESPREFSQRTFSTGDSLRLFELSIGLNKFNNSDLKEKLFGTGWYSSRINISSLRNKMIDELDLNDKLSKSNVTQLQGFVALLLDTGLFGTTFTIFLFGILLKRIIESPISYVNRFFYLLLISINFLTMFIGFPWINIPFLLMFLPNGISLLDYEN